MKVKLLIKGLKLLIVINCTTILKQWRPFMSTNLELCIFDRKFDPMIMKLAIRLGQRATVTDIENIH